MTSSPSPEMLSSISGLVRDHETAASLSVDGVIVPIDRSRRYVGAKTAETVAAMGPRRVLALDADGCVLGAVEFADADAEAEAGAETNAAIYSRAYRDVLRMQAQCMAGAQAAQAAALELMREAARMRGESERERLAAARREGLLQAEHVRLRALRARHQQQLSAPASEGGEEVAAPAPEELQAAIAEVLPPMLRPLLMQILPELAAQFGLLK